MLLRFPLRSFVKTFSKNIYAFSTAPPGNAPAFKFPRRWNLKVGRYDEVFSVVGGLTQYKQFATFLKVVHQQFRIIWNISLMIIWVLFTKHLNT
jgi:hypothetical protein